MHAHVSKQPNVHPAAMSHPGVSRLGNSSRTAAVRFGATVVGVGLVWTSLAGCALAPGVGASPGRPTPLPSPTQAWHPAAPGATEDPAATPVELLDPALLTAQCAAGSTHTGGPPIVISGGPPQHSPTGPHCDPWYACGNDAYQFPLTPQSDPEEWAAHDPAGLAELLQVPSDTVASMSTAGLVQTVLSYPYLGDVAAHNTPQSGFEATRQSFAAIDALLARPDAAAHLSALYDTRPEWIAQTDESGSTRLTFLELLLAQPEVLQAATAQDRAVIATVALQWSHRQGLVGHDDPPAEAGAYSGGQAIRVAMRALAQDDPAFAARMAADPTAAGYLRTGMLVICSAQEWSGALEDLYATAAATYPS